MSDTELHRVKMPWALVIAAVLSAAFYPLYPGWEGDVILGLGAFCGLVAIVSVFVDLRLRYWQKRLAEAREDRLP